MTKMTLNEIGELFLKLAKDKGWGHTKSMLSVPEKMMLINTEITELQQAVKNNPKNPKDTIESELTDILGRTLHLGLAWGVDFDAKRPFKSRFGRHKGKLTESDFLYLHSLASNGYDDYRHKKTGSFKKHLYVIAQEVVFLAESLGIDVKRAVMTKIKINKKRSWNKNELRGNYYKQDTDGV